MLHVFAGTDTIAVRKHAFLYIQEIAEGSSSSTISSDNFVPGMLKDAMGSHSLFGGRDVYVLDTPSSHEDFQIEFLDIVKELRQSEHEFILIEDALLAPAKKSLEKYADSFEYFVSDKKEAFNVFALSDALVARDKKTLWVLLQKAKLNGLTEEAIVGTLWWQLKSMLLVVRTQSAAQAGMNSFVYDKTRRALRLYTVSDIEQLSHSLLTLYHRGHAGETEFDLGLEQWVLGL